LDYNDIINLIFDNLKKIVFPEEWLNIDLALSKQEVFAMFLVQRQGEIIMSQVADYVNVPMSTATGIIDRLVRNGYMERERSDTDRRVVVIKLTEKGKSLIEGLIQTGSEYIRMISEGLTGEERDTLYSIITKILRILNDKNQKIKEKEQDETQIRKINIE
jgi:DNA-binding MarR family transcriptional regulator